MSFEKSREEKLQIFKQLNSSEKNELKREFDFFESRFWLTEPDVKMYGVTWTHTDLGFLFDKSTSTEI